MTAPAPNGLPPDLPGSTVVADALRDMPAEGDLDGPIGVADAPPAAAPVAPPVSSPVDELLADPATLGGLITD